MAAHSRGSSNCSLFKELTRFGACPAATRCRSQWGHDYNAQTKRVKKGGPQFFDFLSRKQFHTDFARFLHLFVWYSFACKRGAAGVAPLAPLILTQNPWCTPPPFGGFLWAGWRCGSSWWAGRFGWAGLRGFAFGLAWLAWLGSGGCGDDGGPERRARVIGEQRGFAAVAQGPQQGAGGGGER